MSSSNMKSRRDALKLFSGSALLPLAGGFGLSSVLTACGGGDGGGDVTPTPVPTPTGTPTPVITVRSTRFTGMAAPTLAVPNEMATTLVKSALDVAYSDGSTKSYKLGYKPFFITGQTVNKTGGGTIIAGGYFDLNGAPINDASVAGKERQFFSDCPDGTSLLQPIAGVNKAALGVKGNPVFAVVQFEYTSHDQSGSSKYGQLPSPIAVLTLDQDPATGALELVSYHNVPMADAHGLWITCGASLSPWNTHLSSEEYEPDALGIATNTQFNNYIDATYGDANAHLDPVKANPYLYGHLPEITVKADGTGTVTKHYCLGRISHELVHVCPDQRTVLMGDDATNGGAFIFVADKAADLSAGTLYVGKWTQTSGVGPGAGKLSWIKLGHATSAEIETLAKTLTLADIMDVSKTDPSDASFTKIRVGGSNNWVRLKPGMEKAAAFLETHRYAALVGASMGFTKWEGTTVDPTGKVAYVAMSSITKSMTDGTTDIQVQGPKSGAVYALNLKGGQKDDTNTAINSEWVPVDMAPPAALVGEDLAVADALGNTANANKLGNPDNLKFSDKLRTLFIGEDSGMHVNNFLWAYNVDTKELTRILSCPAGAESTGLHGVDDINGWTYIMSNFQHAGDWESIHAGVKTTLDPLIKANYNDGYGAAVGYLTGLPQEI
ncbi:PhoX family protein [Chitinibacteraceae bacterium HSL-7]